jgi:hypothetical protein
MRKSIRMGFVKGRMFIFFPSAATIEKESGAEAGGDMTTGVA